MSEQGSDERAIEAIAAYIGDHSTEHEEGSEDWLAQARRFFAPIREEIE